jgi:hypothetical protein
MSTSHFDTQLEQLELQCQAVQASLLSGNAAALQAGSAALLRLTVEVSQLAGEAGATQLDTASRANRVKALASGIAILREGLLRQLAYVERGLEIVVPATREKATYATGGAYGSPVRQSGSFSFLSA